MNMMNNETYENMLSAFLFLPDEEKIAVLAQAAFRLTVFARDTYLPDSDGLKQPEQLRIYNEMQHKLLEQLNKILIHDENRYPDDFFLKMLLEMAQHTEVFTRLQHTVAEIINMQPSSGLEKRTYKMSYA